VSSVRVVKRTKVKEEDSAVGEVCLSSQSTKDNQDVVTILGFIDEVLLFAGKPVLWSLIQEEIYSLHKRYTTSGMFLMQVD